LLRWCARHGARCCKWSCKKRPARPDQHGVARIAPPPLVRAAFFLRRNTSACPHTGWRFLPANPPHRALPGAQALFPADDIDIGRACSGEYGRNARPGARDRLIMLKVTARLGARANNLQPGSGRLLRYARWEKPPGSLRSASPGGDAGGSEREEGRAGDNGPPRPRTQALFLFSRSSVGRCDRPVGVAELEDHLLFHVLVRRLAELAGRLPL
jgi:hypothetical protein